MGYFHKVYPWLNYAFIHLVDLLTFIILYEFSIIILTEYENSQFNLFVPMHPMQYTSALGIHDYASLSHTS